MLTWDPFTPYEGHPDHRAVAVAANEAASFSHFPNFYPEQIADGLAPHYVGESWYFAKSPRDQNKFVDIDAHIDTKIEALWQHEAQMVLTVADMKHHLAASGLERAVARDLDPHDYRSVIEKQMRAAGTRGRRAIGPRLQLRRGIPAHALRRYRVSGEGSDDSGGRLVKLGCSSWSYHAAFRAGSHRPARWLRLCAEEMELDGVELVDLHFPTTDPSTCATSRSSAPTCSSPSAASPSATTSDRTTVERSRQPKCSSGATSPPTSARRSCASSQAGCRNPTAPNGRVASSGRSGACSERPGWTSGGSGPT